MYLYKAYMRKACMADIRLIRAYMYMYIRRMCVRLICVRLIWQIYALYI
jgi:hypothetical protein